MPVEISCHQFKDLNFTVENDDKLDPDSLEAILEKAGEIVEECEKRQFVGGVCTGNCPIPRIYLAGYDEIRAAINQARKTGGELKSQS